MEEKNKHIDELHLLSFLQGELSDEQTKALSQWLLQSEENQKKLDSLEAVWAETGKLTPTPVAVDIPSAWHTLNTKIDEFENNSKKSKVIPLTQRKMFRVVSGIAAALIIAIGIFQLIVDNEIVNMQFASTDKVVYNSLPDGSEIALNLNTTITFPKKFNKDVREVNLNGEAFFSVKHKPEQPFIVNAGNAKVMVLGTKFKIDAKENGPVHVAVTSGKVMLFRVDSVSGDTASVIMRGGQQGTLLKDAREPNLIDEPMFPDELFWMKRTLEFRQTPLAQVVQILEKNYQIDIRIENARVNNCTYTASFKDANIKHIMDMLMASFDFELLQQNNSYILRGNACLDD